MVRILKYIKHIILSFNLKRKGVKLSNIRSDVLYETDYGRYICTSCGYDFTDNYLLIYSDKCPRCSQVFNEISYNPYGTGRCLRSIDKRRDDSYVEIHYN